MNIQRLGMLVMALSTFFFMLTPWEKTADQNEVTKLSAESGPPLPPAVIDALLNLSVSLTDYLTTMKAGKGVERSKRRAG